MKFQTEGTQLFTIPNDAEGLAFLALCKKYLNSKRHRLVPRGRGKRPKYNECGYYSHTSLRKGDSQYFAVYDYSKHTKEEMAEQSRRANERWEHRKQIADAVKLVQENIYKI
jgi:hypothetical protein